MPADGKRRLIAVDESAVIVDYEGGATVDAICSTRQPPLTRLYRILDRHQVPRRWPNAPRLKRLLARILRDYNVGADHRGASSQPDDQCQRECRCEPARTDATRGPGGA